MFLGAHPTTLKGAATAVMPGVAASLVATEGADVFSAFVGVGAGVFAALQATEGADTVSMAVRTANNVATLATTEAPDTFAGTINYGRVVASVVATEGADTLSFTANVGRVVATLATTEGADTLSFIARTGNVSGALATTEGADTVSMTATAAAPNAGLRPQDVFAILTQPANQMQAAIDALPFSPDILIEKDRVAGTPWDLRDTLRGLNRTQSSNAMAAESAWPGYSGTNARVAFAFKEQAKLAVRIVWVGDGAGSRQLPHGLTIAPGMVIAKSRDTATDWYVQHNVLTGSQTLRLNLINTPQNNAAVWNSTPATDSVLTIGSALNQAGVQYFAWLFAHDPSPSGIIQCGQLTEAPDSKVVSLPYPGQYLITKTFEVTDGWRVVDTARGSSATTNSLLRLNTSQAESLGSPFYLGPDGIYQNSDVINGASKSVYLIIRAPIT